MQTCLKSNEPAIRYNHYQLQQTLQEKIVEGWDQIILQIISLNTSVDTIRVSKGKFSV